MAFFQWLGRIDRRVIYAISALAVIIPLLSPLGLPVTVTSQVKQAYDVLNSIPEGGKVLIGFDFHPGASGEVLPQALAVMRILASRNVKVVTFTGYIESVNFPVQASQMTYEAAGKKYGTDYVDLGYFAGSEASLAAFCKDVRSVFKGDVRGNSIDSLPLMKEIKAVEDFNLVATVNTSGGGVGVSPEMYIRQVNIAHKGRLIACVQGVMGPSYLPFLQSKNLEALMTGLKSAAELEKLSNKPASGTAAVDALSMANLMVVVLLILGNIGYFVEKKAKRAPGGPVQGGGSR